MMKNKLQEVGEMIVNVYKTGINRELMGTHEISSTGSLSEVVSFYLGKDTEISEKDGLDFISRITAGQNWLFGDAVFGPLFLIEHVDAEHIMHNRMRAFYVSEGKTDLGTVGALKYHPGDMFYGIGMSKKYDGIKIRSISERDHLKDLGDETCRARWIYFEV